MLHSPGADAVRCGIVNDPTAPMAAGVVVQMVYVSRDGAVYSESLSLRPGQSVRDAIARSGVLKQYPEIDLSTNRVGIFGRLCTLDSIPLPGDQIEIYRPLVADPKSVRRKRARISKAGTA